MASNEHFCNLTFAIAWSRKRFFLIKGTGREDDGKYQSLDHVNDMFLSA